VNLPILKDDPIERVRGWLPPRGHRATVTIASPDLQAVIDALDAVTRERDGALDSLREHMGLVAEARREVEEARAAHDAAEDRCVASDCDLDEARRALASTRTAADGLAGAVRLYERMHSVATGEIATSYDYEREDKARDAVFAALSTYEAGGAHIPPTTGSVARPLDDDGAQVEAPYTSTESAHAPPPPASLVEVPRDLVRDVVRRAFDDGVRWQSSNGETLSTRAAREAEAVERAIEAISLVSAYDAAVGARDVLNPRAESNTSGGRAQESVVARSVDNSTPKPAATPSIEGRDAVCRESDVLDVAQEQVEAARIALARCIRAMEPLTSIAFVIDDELEVGVRRTALTRLRAAREQAIADLRGLDDPGSTPSTAPGPAASSLWTTPAPTNPAPMPEAVIDPSVTPEQVRAAVDAARKRAPPSLGGPPPYVHPAPRRCEARRGDSACVLEYYHRGDHAWRSAGASTWGVWRVRIAHAADASLPYEERSARMDALAAEVEQEIEHARSLPPTAPPTSAGEGDGDA
jgi:hypothetical protein